MARPKKPGRRAKGVVERNGILYITIRTKELKDGKTIYKKKWINTHLDDTPTNVKAASDLRDKWLNAKNFASMNLDVSLTDYIQSYLAQKKDEIADTTYSSYLYKARHIMKYFGNTKVKNITSLMAKAFLDSLLKETTISPRTVKDIKVLFGNIMEQAYKEGIIPHNPVKEVVIDKKLVAKNTKSKAPGEDFFSYEEAKIFLERLKNDPDKNYSDYFELFYLTIFFGLRREEVLGLRWQSINLKNKTMIINHTITKGTTITRANSTKTKSSMRVYPLTDEQVEMFKRLKEKENQNKDIWGNCYKPNDYVFKSESGEPLHPDVPSRKFKRFIKKNPDLPQAITFHGLRSSCVSILVHQGKDIKSIQAWVGHADINTTLKIYAKVKEMATKGEISSSMATLIPLTDYSNE